MNYLNSKITIQYKNYKNRKTQQIYNYIPLAYSDNFEVVQESNKWMIKIKKPLDADTYARNSEIVTTMEATEREIEKGLAVLVIELTDDSSNDDTIQPYYIVQYKPKGQH